jgi:dTDP-4-amino-4,6-dideoxygalactose transaminase
MTILFNKFLHLGNEIDNLKIAVEESRLSGDGQFNKKCSEWFKQYLSCQGAFLTPSCTAALEMGLMLAGIEPGDEVILPSFTFTSTATAIVLHGGVPVFIDCHPETLNINENLIEAAITNKTKVIMPVHYAGVSCHMKKIMAIAKKHSLIVLEDAAQCIDAYQEGKPVGSQGHMSAFSFHDTKNITCGEGGVLCINDSRFVDQAEISREKGSNRQQFFRGEVDKYSWQDKGGSYLMSELQAAYLFAQLEMLSTITQDRVNTWNTYHDGLASLDASHKLQRPTPDAGAQHNAHLYYLILPDAKTREGLYQHLKKHNIHATAHYVPLHTSPAGQRFGRDGSEISVCTDLSDRLLRLPLFYGLTQDEANQVVDSVREFFSNKE